TDRIERERRRGESRGEFRRDDWHLLWNGQPFQDRNVVVRCLHGLGDTLQFIRYVPLLRRLARSITVLLQPQLLDLFAGTDEFGGFRNWSATDLPDDRLEIEVMELPYAFRSTLNT